MLAVYARHGADKYFSYRRSDTTNPVSPSDWAAEQSIPNIGASITYANPFQLSAEAGKIYNFCRATNFNPTVFTSTDGGSNWSAPQHLIKTGTGSTRPYVKYCSDYSNRIDFLYTDGHPRDVNNSLYHLYYTGGAFYQTDGTWVKNYADLPLLHSSGESGSVIYPYTTNAWGAGQGPDDWIPFGRAWTWDLGYQPDGKPVCAFQVQVDGVTGSATNFRNDRIYYYYARWDGSQWLRKFIAHAGRGIFSTEDDYGGGMCIDPENPNVVYLSSNVADPFELSTLAPALNPNNERYELWRGVTSDGGLTFAWTPVTTNSAQDNLRPYVPRRNGGEPCVLWFRGNYPGYTSYSTAVVGLFTTAVPTPPPPPPPPPGAITGAVVYVDATSGADGNTTLADGTTFNPPLNGTTGADQDWEQRTPYASGGNVFESGGEAAENAPELRLTLTNLIAGANYSIYAFFWDVPGTSDNWSLRAGFTSAPGANPLYSAADATGILTATAAVAASSLTYANAPTLFAEGNRILQAAPLGTVSADPNGVIRVYVDDKPSTTGANNRTWFDGLGCARVIAALDAMPTILPPTLSGTNLLLQTVSLNGFTYILQATPQLPATNWTPVATNLGNGGTLTFTIPILPGAPGQFFRLSVQ